jgi:hypothetical protein
MTLEPALFSVDWDLILVDGNDQGSPSIPEIWGATSNFYASKG